MLARMPKRAEELPAHEELLHDYAERLGRHLPGRRAIHLHLCQLKPHNKRPHHIRIAASSFDGLVQRHEGQCFTLANRDIVVVVRDASVSQIDEVVLKLRFLFSDDPLVAQEDSGEETQERFVTWYDLEDADYPRFLAMARRMRAAAKKAAAEEAEAVDEPAKDDGPEPTVPLDPEKLNQLEKQLVGADIAGMLRRQPICAMLPGQPAKPVFNEVFVSMEELRKRVLPEVNLFSSRWLFQHMTEVLDQRLLKELPDQEGSIKLSTSLNLNVSTLLSEQFLAFDRQLRNRTKKAMVIELQTIDVFGDVGAYQFARDFVRERGYKVCLDGLNYLTFPLLARSALDVDFQKIIWAPDLVEEDGSDRRDAFVQAVKQTEATRVILCRCDSMDAVRYGQALGITLFQGRLIDRLAKSGDIV